MRPILLTQRGGWVCRYLAFLFRKSYTASHVMECTMDMVLQICQEQNVMCNYVIMTIRVEETHWALIICCFAAWCRCCFLYMDQPNYSCSLAHIHATERKMLLIFCQKNFFAYYLCTFIFIEDRKWFWSTQRNTWTQPVNLSFNRWPIANLWLFWNSKLLT